jgi:hypothetical protein
MTLARPLDRNGPLKNISTYLGRLVRGLKGGTFMCLLACWAVMPVWALKTLFLPRHVAADMDINSGKMRPSVYGCLGREPA